MCKHPRRAKENKASDYKHRANSIRKKYLKSSDFKYSFRIELAGRPVFSSIITLILKWRTAGITSHRGCVIFRAKIMKLVTFGWTIRMNIVCAQETVFRYNKKISGRKKRAWSPIGVSAGFGVKQWFIYRCIIELAYLVNIMFWKRRKDTGEMWDCCWMDRLMF